MNRFKYFNKSEPMWFRDQMARPTRNRQQRREGQLGGKPPSLQKRPIFVSTSTRGMGYDKILGAKSEV